MQESYITSILDEMHHSLMYGRLDKVKNIYLECLRKDISFSMVDDMMVQYLNGYTILQYAFGSSNKELIIFLIDESGIDINKKCMHGMSILHYIGGYGLKYSIPNIEYLLKNKKININTCNPQGLLAIETASFYNMKDYVQLLICYGSEYNIEKCIIRASYCHNNSLIEWFDKRR